jgi:aminomethyltransferase
LLALQGPEAAQVVERLGLVPLNEGWSAAHELKFMQSAPYRWGDVPLRVSRSGYTGEDGFEISVPADHAASFADALCAEPEVRPIGLGARDSLRLEAGLPLYGHDLGPETDPIEADLGFAINKRRRAEGGFPGAETILASLGAPARKRVGLLVEGKMTVREGASIHVPGGEPIGQITSGGFSPTLQRPIAMGYVDARHAVPGTALEAEVRGKRIGLTVATLPFVPHRYHR